MQRPSARQRRKLWKVLLFHLNFPRTENPDASDLCFAAKSERQDGNPVSKAENKYMESPTLVEHSQ